jgi:protein TonB
MVPKSIVDDAPESESTMSAAVNDRPHEIVPLPHLPLTGELHPLRREFARWLATGNVITITLAVVVCATLYFWPRPAPQGYIDIPMADGPISPSPPPISDQGGGNENLAVAPDVGKANFEPTKDEDLKTATEPVDNPGDGNGDEPSVDDAPGSFTSSAPVDIKPSVPAPRSDGFVPFDTEPVLISIDKPVYPDMVRDAGIDGTVLVRVFVALNGHVKDAYVVDGNSALREAAVTAARTAFFKPALAGTHPVEVWVVIPITFELRERY